MRIYDGSCENMVFLSPYVNVYTSDKGLYIFSTLFLTNVFLECDKEQAEYMLSLLKNGVTLDELNSFFKKLNNEADFCQIIEDWMRKGVLE